MKNNQKIKFTLLILLVLSFVIISGCINSQGTPNEVTSIPSNIPTPSVSSIYTPTISVTPLPSITSPPANLNGQDNLTVHFIDVGQGDSELIKIGDKVMLVDGGPIDAGSSVVSYLRSQGVNSIDVLVSTHPHEDHIGGLLTVLKEIPVKEVIDSGQVTTTQTYESYLTLIDQKNIPFHVAERGQTIDLSPNIKIEVLSPPSGMVVKDDLNENSIVLRVTYGGVKFLLMGDAGTNAESNLIAAGYDLKCDVLKVGHHGSHYSSSEAFLSQAKPSISVIEVGANNDYGHPAPETIQKLQHIGSQIYRTDLNGNVVITTNGATYSVVSQHSQTANNPLPTTNPQNTVATAKYIGNSNTMKFHLSTCRYVSSIAPGHIVYFNSRDEAISKGYVPCKVCNP